MKPYKRIFKESFDIPKKFDGSIEYSIESKEDLKNCLRLIIKQKEGFNIRDIEFGEATTTFNKIPGGGSSYFSIPFEDKEMGVYGSYNVYTPVGFLNFNSERAWIDMSNPTNNSHRIINIVKN